MTDHTRPTDDFSVLVIEDQADVAQSFQLYLQLVCKYKVSVAADGQTGIKMAIRDRPNAVICDINLPARDGFDVATEVMRSLLRKPLLIAVTAYDRDGIVERARTVGYDWFFVKPADPAALVDLLRARASEGQDPSG